MFTLLEWHCARSADFQVKLSQNTYLKNQYFCNPLKKMIFYSFFYKEKISEKMKKLVIKFEAVLLVGIRFGCLGDHRLYNTDM